MNQASAVHIQNAQRTKNTKRNIFFGIGTNITFVSVILVIASYVAASEIAPLFQSVLMGLGWAGVAIGLSFVLASFVHRREIRTGPFDGRPTTAAEYMKAAGKMTVIASAVTLIVAAILTDTLDSAFWGNIGMSCGLAMLLGLLMMLEAGALEHPLKNSWE